MKKLVISFLFVMQVFFVFAQDISGVSGKVIDAKTKKPLQNAIAAIQNSNLTQLTNAEGKFTFETVAAGIKLVQIKSTGYKDQLLSVEIVAGKILDLGTFTSTKINSPVAEALKDNLPCISGVEKPSIPRSTNNP